MKKTILLFTAICLLYSCGIIQQNNAIDYNNSLITEQEKVADQMNIFIDMITSEDSISHTEVFEKRKEIMDFIDQSIVRVEAMGEFDNSTTFKESIVKVMQAYKNGIENEYTTMAQYTLLPIEDQTPDKYIETQQQAYIADSLISLAENEFIEAQVVFASKQNLELEEAPDY